VSRGLIAQIFERPRLVERGFRSAVGLAENFSDVREHRSLRTDISIDKVMRQRQFDLLLT